MISDFATTKHAEARINQRGIKIDAIDVLLDFGSEGYHDGASVLYMDKDAHKRARKALGQKLYADVQNSLNTYIVIGHDGQIITVAKRYKRLKFH